MTDQRAAAFDRVGATLRVAVLSVVFGLPTACSAAADQPSEFGRRHALVIGNAAYKSFPTLRNPVNDSDAVCQSLRALRFEAECRHNLADRRKLLDAVREFADRLQPQDVALFYFAGHGIEIGGENFLVPTAADIQDRSTLEAQAFRLGVVFEVLRESRARLSIFILDACRENPFDKVRSLTTGGLAAPATMPAGSIIIFPTAPGGLAYDGRGKHGLFTSQLLRHVSSPDLTIEEMFKQVIEGVRRESSLRYGQEQVPWINLSFSDEFCFAGCATRVNKGEYQALMQDKQQVQRLSVDLREYKSRVAGLESVSRDREVLLLTMRGDLESREKELSAVRERLATLQDQLRSRSQGGKLSEAAIASLRQEGDALVESSRLLGDRDRELQAVREQLGKLDRALTPGSRDDVDELRARLAQYDQQQAELSNYKARLAEAEKRLRDAAAAAVKDAAFVAPAL